MARPPLENLDLRSRRLLRALVTQYIHDGEPVGSRSLSRLTGIDLSPATIRNVLADLEDSGLLAAPHSSAGRIPTDQGYRLFVDALLEAPPSMPMRQVEQLRDALPNAAPAEQMATAMSELMSATTRFVGVVSVPKKDNLAVRQLDFVALSPFRVLVILVFTDGQVQNRVIESETAIAPAQLEAAANLINRHYAGRSLREVRANLLSDLQSERLVVDELMHRSLMLGEQALAAAATTAASDIALAGQSNLLSVGDLADLERLRGLFDAFYEKRALLGLLERCIHAEGVKIFIGDECGKTEFKDCALITAPYQVGNHTLGVLGVIGPKRMAYEKIIPFVEASAHALSQALRAE
jgi:heat-inducible transcriptional repressor